MGQLIASLLRSYPSGWWFTESQSLKPATQRACFFCQSEKL